MTRRAGGGKILVVNPPLLIKRDFIDYPYFANLGALQNAAVLEANGFHARVADAFSLRQSSAYPAGGDNFLAGCGIKRFLASIEEKDFDAILVCLSVFHRPFSRDKFTGRFLDALGKRFPGVPLVAADAYFGGMHYIDYDSDAFFANYPVVGSLIKYESESELLKWAAAGPDDRTPPRVRKGKGREIDLDTLPYPAWHAVDVNNYFKFLSRFFKATGRTEELADIAPYLPVVTSRGCLYGCSFCSTHTASGKRAYRRYSADYMRKYLRHLKKHYSIAGIAVLDGLANGDKKQFGLFLDAVESQGLRVSFVNGLRADRLLRSHATRLSRITPSLSFSVESASRNVRNGILKKNLSLEAAEKAAGWCKHEGLPLNIHYMVGVPGETKSEVNETFENALAMASVYGAAPLIQFCVPLPGTPLHRRCAEQSIELEPAAGDYFPFFFKKPCVETGSLNSRTLAGMVSIFKSRLEWLTPEKLIINLTYRCNNKCKMCAVGDRPRRDMDAGTCRKLLEDYFSRRVKMVDFDGGEPTIHPDFFKIIDAARRIGYEKITVTTNGRRLASRKFAARVLSGGITDLLISLYSHNSRTHEKITEVPGSFDQTVRGIRNALQLKPDGVNFGVNTVVVKDNYRNIGALMKLLVEFGVPRLNVQFPTPFGRARREHTPPLKEACDKLGRAIGRYGGKLEVRVINLPPCVMPEHKELVVADIEKYARHMAFVDTPPESLGVYLGRRRERSEECGGCVFYIVCEGFYAFEGEGPECPGPAAPQTRS